MIDGNGQRRDRRGDVTGRLRWLVMWTIKNVAIILTVIFVVTIVYGILAERSAGRAAGAPGRVVFGAALIAPALLPGGLLYLVALWMIPDRWEVRRQRRWALILSPIVALLVWTALLEDRTTVLPSIAYGLGMSIPAGLLVRLRHRRSSL